MYLIPISPYDVTDRKERTNAVPKRDQMARQKWTGDRKRKGKAPTDIPQTPLYTPRPATTSATPTKPETRYFQVKKEEPKSIRNAKREHRPAPRDIYNAGIRGRGQGCGCQGTTSLSAGTQNANTKSRTQHETRNHDKVRGPRTEARTAVAS